MLRVALVLLSLLWSGCLFDEFDHGCPGKSTVTSIRASQVLEGPWDMARAWRSINNTTVWSVGFDDAVLGNFTHEVGDVAVWVRAWDFNGPHNRTALATMIFSWPRCVGLDDYASTLEREKERRTDQWSSWRERFSQETDMNPRAPEEWVFGLPDDGPFFNSPPPT